MKAEKHLFEIWLSLRCPVATAPVRELLTAYGSPYELYAAGEREIAAMPCSHAVKKALLDKDLSEADRILEACRAQNISILFWQDDKYPVSLHAISDPPLLLYVAGKLPDLNRRLCISVVGSRTAEDYAREATYRLSYELSAAGAVIVSGMALGVDALASAGALAGGGETVAVLACGVDIAYPLSHRKLRRAIMEQGAVISEYPPGTPIARWRFPARNRIISGLSQGTLVVQAAQGSGALITAERAAQQGRDIFALPGKVSDKASEGTNLLLRDGATFVQDVTDILGKYETLFADVLSMSALTRAKRSSQLDEAFCARLEIHCKQEMEDASKDTPHRRAAAPAEKPPFPVAEKQAPAHEQKPPVPQPTRRAETHAPVPPPAAPREGDSSETVLATLTERQRQMFALLPLDRAVPVGYLVKAGFTTPEVLANMTILASKGLVSILPGSLYIRA